MMRITAALVLIVGAGLVHGKWTNRWGPSAALAALAARVDSVPMVIGDWQGTASELSDTERAAAGATACLARVYSNPSRKVSITVLLLGGLPGIISTHTPDVCYPRAGYILESPASYEFRFGPDQKRAEFHTARAARGGTSPSVLRLFWSWNASQGWSSPQEPRWHFASQPALCKLYVVRETAGADVDPRFDPCNDFLKVFLPELDRLVFSVPR
jgi:hypothetical protein